MVLREREILSGAQGHEFKVYISVVLSILNKAGIQLLQPINSNFYLIYPRRRNYMERRWSCLSGSSGICTVQLDLFIILSSRQPALYCIHPSFCILPIFCLYDRSIFHSLVEFSLDLSDKDYQKEKSSNIKEGPEIQKFKSKIMFTYNLNVFDIQLVIAHRKQNNRFLSTIYYSQKVKKKLSEVKVLLFSLL